MIPSMEVRHRLHQLAVIIISAAALTAPVAAGVGTALPEFHAAYTLYKGAFRIGEAEIRLHRDGGRRVYSSHTEPAGFVALFRDDVITERSVWVYNNGDIRPLEYQYRHQGSKKNRNVELAFHWDENRVDNTAEGHTWSMDIPDGTLDKFSVQLAVMLDLQQQREYTDLEYPIADGGKLKNWRFDVVGTEPVEVEAGEFDTVKIVRLRDSYDRHTTMWCAPALNYLLVKIQHTEPEDGTFTMELDKVEGLPRQATAAR